MDGSIDARVDRSSGLPLGTQLVDRIRASVEDGRLGEGDRLPSVRELAEAARVNVNTVRAVYARLEAEGVVRREHGRGTFVAGPGGPDGARASSLARSSATRSPRSRRRSPACPRRRCPRTGRAAGRPPRRSLSTEELLDVRNRLLERLEQLDTERTALLESLEQLGVGTRRRERPGGRSRRATPSLAGARIRWVGGLADRLDPAHAPLAGRDDEVEVEEARPRARRSPARARRRAGRCRLRRSRRRRAPGRRRGPG